MLPIQDLKDIQELGAGFTALGIILVLFFGFSYLLFIFVKNKITCNKISDPKDHLFFTKNSRYIKQKVPRIEFYYHHTYAPNRTRLLRDMLIINFQKWGDCLNYFIKNPPLNTQEYAELINSMVDNYTRDWEKLGVPPIVIEKFNDWHACKSDVIIESGVDIIISNSYSDKNEKINAILDLHKAFLDITITDAEKTLGQLNGEISGLNYKGLILE